MKHRGSDMQRGYTLSTPELDKVVCINKDKDGFILSEIFNSKILNNSMCFNTITAAKTVQERIVNFDPAFPELQIITGARLDNKFLK